MEYLNEIFDNFQDNFGFDGWSPSCSITQGFGLRWTSLYLTDDKSILVQVMAKSLKATNNYLSANVDPDLCRHMTSVGHIELRKLALNVKYHNISGSTNQMAYIYVIPWPVICKSLDPACLLNGTLRKVTRCQYMNLFSQRRICSDSISICR